MNDVAIAKEMKGLNANGKSKFVDFRGTRKVTILLWCGAKKLLNGTKTEGIQR